MIHLLLDSPLYIYIYIYGIYSFTMCGPANGDLCPCYIKSYVPLLKVIRSDHVEKPTTMKTLDLRGAENPSKEKLLLASFFSSNDLRSHCLNHPHIHSFLEADEGT